MKSFDLGNNDKGGDPDNSYPAPLTLKCVYANKKI